MARSTPARRRAPAAGLALAAGLVALPPAGADVVESAPDGFTVQTVYDVEASPAQVYQALVGAIGSWWHPDHTFSGDPARLTIEARPNGCFCEQLDAGGVRHMTVVYVEAGKMVRMVGGLGPLQSEPVSGAMTWSVEEQGEGSRLAVTYKVAGSSSAKLDEWAPAVDAVLAQAADRLVKFVSTGSPE